MSAHSLISAPPKSKIFEKSAPIKTNNIKTIQLLVLVLDEHSLPNRFMEIDDSDKEEVDEMTITDNDSNMM